MSPLRKIISGILNTLLEPLLCRIVDRLIPIHYRLHAQLLERLETLEGNLAPPFLMTVIKNEIQNIEKLPLPLLTRVRNLTVIGYCAEEIAPILPGCRVSAITDWLNEESPIMLDSPFQHLLFLDEYYFMRAMHRMASPIFPVADSIIVATRFKHLKENYCRSTLHQLGFMEISLVALEPLTGNLLIFAVSHATPVSCEPIFVDDHRPPLDPHSQIVWLVARSTPQLNRKEGRDV